MKNSYDVTEIEAAYEKILANKVFKKSSLQERILRYLIDQALAGNDVNEHSIGIDLFKEKYSADHNDSKIRVYVFYLRKKLAEYYNGIGREECIIFHIEKGQYNLTFNQNSYQTNKTTEEVSINLHLLKKLSKAILAILIITIAVYIISDQLKPAYLWKPFLKGNTACVIADHYMFANQLKNDKHIFSTFREVNNELDLTHFRKENPSISLKPASFTMTSKMASFGIHYLDLWFRKYDQCFDVQLETETQLSDYMKMNIIYIGQAPKMQASKPFFLSKSKVFELDTDGFTYNGEDGVTHFKSSHSEVSNQEYAMVSFQKLDNGKYNLFFVSNHDIGVLGTLKMFTSRKRLKEFVKNLPSADTEFNALFKVRGLKRTEMSCELVKLEIN